MIFLESLLLLGLWPILFMVLFIIAMTMSCTADRRAEPEPKWYVFCAFAVIGILWHSIVGGWSATLSKLSWVPFALYFSIGVVYSLLEFMVQVRKSARLYELEWTSALQSNMHISNSAEGEPEKRVLVTYQHVINMIISNLGSRSRYWNDVHEFAQRFIVRQNSQRYDIIKLNLAEDGITPEPAINRTALAEHLGVWVLFWPFYLISLVFGDLLTEVCRLMADAIARASAKIVKSMFSNVFKT